MTGSAGDLKLLEELEAEPAKGVRDQLGLRAVDPRPQQTDLVHELVVMLEPARRALRGVESLLQPRTLVPRIVLSKR